MSRRKFIGSASALLAAGVVGRAAPDPGQPSTSAGGLKVTGYKFLVVDNVHPTWVGFKKWLFIQLETNEGLVGMGERPAGGMRDPKSQIELMKEICDRFVVGQSPFNIERIWQNAYGGMHDYRHPSLYGVPALSAIEMACWDLMGKATNQPIYNLLGGKFNEKLRYYSYFDMQGVVKNPELAGERAAELVTRGITACKFTGFPNTRLPTDPSLETIRRNARIFKSIRDTVGDKLEVGIGTHGQFTTAGAIRVANMLEEFHPFFFEEPVSPENVEEMARVAAHTSIPIATGERLATKYEFSEVVEKQAAQIIQLDVGQCGGILESKKIAAIAEAHYATIAPHMYCGPVAAAAAIQLDVCCPNFLIQEFNTTPLHHELLQEPLRLENGYIIPPNKPGLGIEFDEQVLKRQLSKT